MATFILVHGACHGAWCWHKLIPRLQRGGHRAVAPDLPGHGEDRTPLETLTPDLYVETVAGLLRRRSEKAILVGHSLGGLTLSRVAEAVPDKVARLVYLSAMLLSDGESFRDGRHDQTGSLLETCRVWNEDRTAYIFEGDGLEELFYADCDPADVALARTMMVWEPASIAAEPLSVSAGRYGRIPRAYIECSGDRAFPLATQRSMQAGQPCDPVVTLESDHSPFFSCPDALAEALLALPEAQ